MKRLAPERNLSIAAALLLCAAAAPLLAADDLPKAEAIIDKYIEVTGGKAAYQKLHTEVSSGSIEIVGKGIKGSVTNYRAEPNKTFTEMNFEGIGKMQDGSDGKVSWSLSGIQGPHVKEGDEKNESLREATFNPELNWRDMYKSAQTKSVESVDGKDCYKVELTPASGNPVTQYYEKQSGLLVKTAMVVKSPMGEIPTESIVGDYRKEGGVLVPHKLTNKLVGMEITMTLDSIQYNVEIPKDKFDPPDEIKALVNKKQ